MPSLPQVELRPLTVDEFEPWREEHIRTYSAEVVERFGVPCDVALDRARAEFDGALPHGLDTAGVHVDVIMAEGRRVGTLWWGPNPRRDAASFVHDLAVDAAERGHGYARAAMIAMEAAARDEGSNAIGLSVTASNAVARGLYDSLGYQAKSLNMLKSLD